MPVERGRLQRHDRPAARAARVSGTYSTRSTSGPAELVEDGGLHHAGTTGPRSAGGAPRRRARPPRGIVVGHRHQGDGARAGLDVRRQDARRRPRARPAAVTCWNFSGGQVVERRHPLAEPGAGPVGVGAEADPHVEAGERRRRATGVPRRRRGSAGGWRRTGGRSTTCPASRRRARPYAAPRRRRRRRSRSAPGARARGGSGALSSRKNSPVVVDRLAGGEPPQQAEGLVHAAAAGRRVDAHVRSPRCGPRRRRRRRGSSRPGATWLSVASWRAVRHRVAQAGEVDADQHVERCRARRGPWWRRRSRRSRCRRGS